MVNSCAVRGCCTRTDIVMEHLEDTLRICDVSAKGLLHPACSAATKREQCLETRQENQHSGRCKFSPF
jgi:hypothetical protein